MSMLKPLALLGLLLPGALWASAGTAKVEEKVLTTVLKDCKVDFSSHGCVVVGTDEKHQPAMVKIPAQDEIRYVVYGVPATCKGIDELKNLFIERGKEEVKDVFGKFRKFTWERRATVKAWTADDPGNYIKADNVYILED